MSKLRYLFTPSAGSRARNISRAVLPVLVILRVVVLTPDQIAAIALAVEAVFAGGGQIADKT